MSTDPRAALQSLVNALEEHLAAAANRRSDEDPSVDKAYVAIANAFEAYEEALYDAHDEVTPSPSSPTTMTTTSTTTRMRTTRTTSSRTTR